MSIKQISVFLENRPGALDEMCTLLANHKIDLRALSLAEAQDFGIVRLIVDDAFATANVLKENGFIARFTPVLAYAVPDEPGGLSKLLSAFTKASVNIEYMYAFITISKQYAYVVLRVEDNDKAEKILTENNIPLVTEEDIKKL